MDAQTEARDLDAPQASAPRVVIVLPGLGAGGTEHVVNVVANDWARRGYGITVITLESPDAVAYYPFDPRVAIRRLGVPPQRSSKTRAAILAVSRVGRLRAAIRDSDADAVVSFLTRTNVLTLLATRGMHIPVVVSERNNPALQPFGGLWKWLQARLYPRAHGLVTMTQGALDHFPPNMRRNGWVIANAVDLPPGWQKRRGHNTLAAVGRLTHQKGFDLLLDAFSIVAPKHPDWQLVIWGEGEDRAKLEAQRRNLGLEQRVQMPGITARPGLWIETADAFVLSSRYEGWGIVLLEAMAAELPVVSFDCDWGPKVLITDDVDGLLVAREDTAALAAAIDRLLTDEPLRQRLATRAAQTTQRYLPDRILADWQVVLQSALGDAYPGGSAS